MNQGPVRYQEDKWYMTTEEYPFKKFPDYCEGFAYLMSLHTARKLYDLTSKVPFFWVDDVYVTGFLPYIEGIKHSLYTNDFNWMRMQRHYTELQLKQTMIYLGNNHFYSRHWDSTWIAVQGLCH